MNLSLSLQLSASASKLLSCQSCIVAYNVLKVKLFTIGLLIQLYNTPKH